MISFSAKGIRRTRAARLDIYAIGLSALCVLHCVALPLFVSLMPMVVQAAENQLVHRVLVVVAVPVSLRAIWKARPVHGNRMFVAVALPGLVLLLLAAFMQVLLPYEQPITVAGGALLGSAHLWHWLRTCNGRDIHGLPVERGES